MKLNEEEFQRIGQMLVPHLAWQEEAGEETSELALNTWYMKQVFDGIQSEEEYDAIQATVQMTIYRLIDEGRIVECRPTFDSAEPDCRTLGLPPGEAAGTGRRRRGGRGQGNRAVSRRAPAHPPRVRPGPRRA